MTVLNFPLTPRFRLDFVVERGKMFDSKNPEKLLTHPKSKNTNIKTNVQPLKHESVRFLLSNIFIDPIVCVLCPKLLFFLLSEAFSAATDVSV